jgi:hypothetical protein
MLHLKKVVCGSLNVLADLVAVRRTVQECPKNEHIQRALEKVRACGVCFGMEDIRPLVEINGRHSTIVLSMHTLDDGCSK